ncbi:hypothetical protein [Thiocystis violascens]|uniref:Uncharacterized protein n=1 Tax=Thiocystis violascens (strain ATCC 17096 / DSM 198 / 6111) TaxID=765911 RepID=I3YCK7_THIV6|nr:hypothetical protein [Thiocystis violascens]AFL74725.1 hypothetical protein Thivi_2807 [Thiocystis violascens DSM 198]
MVILAGHDIAADPDRTLAEQSPEDVDAHLAELRQELGLKKTRFREHNRQDIGCTRADKPAILSMT